VDRHGKKLVKELKGVWNVLPGVWTYKTTATVLSTKETTRFPRFDANERRKKKGAAAYLFLLVLVF
jgi:hypothetical protein